mmetsp:Transcript_10527/g.25695  ORF Transcript_10527/g.25695 Transcript_10527/m.25695 type:complete len:218 (-) Transcript_10527:1124-1777(-)
MSWWSLSGYLSYPPFLRSIESIQNIADGQRVWIPKPANFFWTRNSKCHGSFPTLCKWVLLRWGYLRETYKKDCMVLEESHGITNGVPLATYAPRFTKARESAPHTTHRNFVLVLATVVISPRSSIQGRSTVRSDLSTSGYSFERKFDTNQTGLLPLLGTIFPLTVLPYRLLFGICYAHLQLIQKQLFRFGAVRRGPRTLSDNFRSGSTGQLNKLRMM